MDGRSTWTDYDEAGDYAVPNVLSPRDLVFRPDNMDETVPHTLFNHAKDPSVLFSGTSMVFPLLSEKTFIDLDHGTVCISKYNRSLLMIDCS